MKAERFEDLQIWQEARELTRMIYTITNQGSFAQDFGLRDQMRRASVSIMSNIAEGFESRTTNLFIEFLGRAKASAGELRCHLYIALDALYLDQQKFESLFALSVKIIRQISSFLQYLKSYKSNDRVLDAMSDYNPQDSN